MCISWELNVELRMAISKCNPASSQDLDSALLTVMDQNRCNNPHNSNKIEKLKDLDVTAIYGQNLGPINFTRGQLGKARVNEYILK